MSARARHPTRLLVAALLWLGVVGGCGVLLTHLRQLDARIELEEELRDETREGMAAYRLGDPAAWRAHQRRADARIAALHRRRRLVLGLDLALAAIALAPLALLLRTPAPERGGGRRRRTPRN